MESLLSALGIIAALLLAFIAGRGTEKRKKKVDPSPTEGAQKESQQAVKDAENEAAKGTKEANDAHENASNDSVYKRFMDVFSKSPRD